VAGYPDAERFKQAIRAIDGIDAVEWLEIQLPFSDPLADGPVIMAANHAVLRTGASTLSSFALIRELRGKLRCKLALMTYANIPLVMGLERFTTEMNACGAEALIVPDLPYDSPEGEALMTACRQAGIDWIPVFSPGMSGERLKAMLEFCTGFVYVTRKVGITGSESAGQPTAFDLIRQIRQLSKLPVALGFGIQSVATVKQISAWADIAVIGSHLLRLYTDGGLEKMAAFLGEFQAR